MRNIDKLLELVLDYIEDHDRNIAYSINGLCYIITLLNFRKANGITDKEYNKLDRLIHIHRPIYTYLLMWLDIGYWGDLYYWQPAHMKPRIRWIKRRIRRYIFWTNMRKGIKFIFKGKKMFE